MAKGSKYVDGFVLVVPKKHLADYKRMATLGAKIWKKYGALDYVESVGQDLNTNMSMSKKKSLNFPGMTKLKKDEVVVFSYIAFKSRKHRDQVNAKVMKDPAMSPEAFKDKPMPFDMTRMAYGGFEIIVNI